VIDYSGGFTAVTIFKKQEKELLEQIWSYLDEAYPEKGKYAREQFAHIEGLGYAVSQFPDVRSIKTIRGQETLLETIINIPFNSLYMPPKVTGNINFLTAKLHHFSRLGAMVHEIEGFQTPIKSVIFSIICILLAEIVYLSCLRDPCFPQDAKLPLADDLISFWDSMTDPENVLYFPSLEHLWQVRESSPPIFGTLDGNSEILRILIDSPDRWLNFIKKEALNEETQWALEEFVFGLSHEDIQKERELLILHNQKTVNTNDFYMHFGNKPLAYGLIKNSDPRTFYNFFIERHNQASFRKLASVEGPKRTLEEIYLECLTTLTREELEVVS
jgi:hypothetical protein